MLKRAGRTNRERMSRNYSRDERKEQTIRMLRSFKGRELSMNQVAYAIGMRSSSHVTGMLHELQGEGKITRRQIEENNVLKTVWSIPIPVQMEMFK